MNFETLSFRAEDSIGFLTFQRPQALNALNDATLRDLQSFLNQVGEIRDLRCLIVTGAGEKAFIAGADIKEMADRDPATARQMADRGQIIFQQLEDLPMATIAAVNGFALGGGLELAMACDFIVASKTAKLGLPEVSLGLIPGYGGTQRLPRYVGKGVARLMTTTGDIFTAQQCLDWGLVAMVTEPADLMPTCLRLAQSVAKKSPHAVRLAKQAINRGFDLSQPQGLKIEAQLFQDAFDSADRVEGVKAFIEKRPPQFTGA